MGHGAAGEGVGIYGRDGYGTGVFGGIFLVGLGDECERYGCARSGEFYACGERVGGVDVGVCTYI